MRLLGAIFLLSSTVHGVSASSDNDDPNTKQTKSLRGRRSGGSTIAAKLFPTSSTAASTDLSVNFAKTGLDRSLLSIHESELNLPFSPETQTALVDYINLYSIDGNDDTTNICHVDDYMKEQEERRLIDASSTVTDYNGDRVLHGHTSGGHSGMDFVASQCNANLTSTTCIPWSEYFTTPPQSTQEPTPDPLSSSNDYLLTEVKIPCGVCVTLDASPGEALYGTTLEFTEGLNIVGKLIIPIDASIELRTNYVYVQGILSMPEPPAGSSVGGTATGIPSDTHGDRVIITLTGLNDLLFEADMMTDNHHLGEKSVNNKAFVIAGGQLDIHAMDSTCPSWVKLQSIEYGSPLPNIALNKAATQSSTYNNAGNGALAAVDGIDSSFTHTNCWAGINPWWRVDLEDEYTITKIEVVNRLDCCGGRLHDYIIDFFDDNDVQVHSKLVAGQNGNRKTLSIDQVMARYVKITLGDQDCLQLGEVKIYGYQGSFPVESLDKLTVGDDAARCWSTPGSRLMLTPDTFKFDDAHEATVVSSPSAGVIATLPLPTKKTAVDETFGYPDFAVEVALLDRKMLIRGEKETGDHEKIGAHLIVLHTPMIAQHLEGVQFTNVGQQTRLGRYPIHFHMSECVHGSTVAKNVVWQSNQRCFVIHGTHNVTLSENVAYDTRGHCYMLEDGGEWDNKFIHNLGAQTRAPVGFNNRAGLIRDGETDHFPATFWITTPTNHFIGNVAAGSASTGFWFELKLRAPSSSLPINEGHNPKIAVLGTFDDNVAHSNSFRAGITTYETGYRAPEPGTTWHNIRSYKNKGSGLFQHGTNNIYLKGGLLADNGEAARNFHHDNAVYDGVEVIGRSKHSQSLIDQGRLSANCGTTKAGGISLQPNEGLNRGTTIINSKFSGFDVCTGNKNSAVFIEHDQVRNGVFDTTHTLRNNTFGQSDTRVSACLSENAGDNKVRLIAIEDEDGSMSGSGLPGFFIQDDTAITNFIDSASCGGVENCLRFCPQACLRVGVVSVSQALTTRGFNMHIQDGTKSGTVARGKIWFDEKQNHINAPIPFVLPAPASGSPYQISFTDKNGQVAWPGYATFSLDKAPSCTGALVDKSQVEFVMPPVDGRCDDLFHEDNYPDIYGWQNFFAGIAVSQDDVDGAYVISTLRRKSDRGHVNLSRTLDASCFKGLGGRTYKLFGKIRMTDADGNYVSTDGSYNVSPRVTFNLEDVTIKNWNVPTSSDGSWTDWSQEILLPDDTSSAWKARIFIDKAEKNEFHIKDWGMTLVPSESPTVGPTISPSDSPTTANPTANPSNSPTGNPTTSNPTLSPLTAEPTTAAPTMPPVTSAPLSAVPTNLALSGLASASTECYNGWARKINDGNPSSINHSCNWPAPQWVMVDLGKDTMNLIDTIVVKNRADCCGGRLKKFHVEVLDAGKNVAWSAYHDGSVGNGVVKTWSVDGGTGAVGRWVRLRYDDSYQGQPLHIGELEAWGYPIELPSNPPEIVELALNRPATQSSNYGSAVASRGNDGNFANTFHTQCGAHPWWQVDLGVDSFVETIEITNRVQCCGGRLRDALVELIDSSGNVVDSRLIKGSVGNGQLVQVVFNEDVSVGQFVRISMARNDCLHLAEVQVFGFHTMGMPTASPTPELVNLSIGKPGTQSSTFNNAGNGAHAALDGNDSSFTHTNCWAGINQWWRVDLETSDVTIANIEVVNRLDCCGGRLHDYTIDFLDEAMLEVDSILVPGGNGNSKTTSVDFVTGARYIKITLGDQDCLQLGEVRVMGWHN